MAPCPVSWMLVGAVLLACHISTATAGSVIGIDFGSEFLKIALVKPGVPLDIVLTPEGKRKENTMVGFYDGEQLLGLPAENMITRKPRQVFKYPKLMLGKGADCPVKKWYKDHFYPYELEAAEDGRGGIQLSVPGGGGFDALNYTAEALVGQILFHARVMAEKTAEETVKETVITVPPFWGQDQRQAIMDAAELAGLKVLSLMNENTAVAMKYAIDRKFENTKEHNVIFYDMGATSLKTSFVTFSAYDVLDGKKNKTVESFEVKAVAWDEFLGGHDFDAKLAKKFGEEFDEKHIKKNDGKSVFESDRTMARLRKEAQKIKKILSANEATPVNIEALTNDIDFRSSITRDEFEKLCGEEIGRATAPVEQLLRQTGKKPSEVHAVVIIGGGSRVPSIKANLMKTMEREVLNQNLNGDEAAALGAGFYAAGLSPSFRVRKVSVEDIFPFGMTATVSRGASSTSKKKAPEAQVFPADTKMPLKKVLTFNRKEDFYMDIKVSNPDRLPKCDSEFIGVYNISGVEAAVKFNETEKPKISVTFELDRSGLLTVTKAEAKVDSYTEEQVEIKVNKTDTNATDANATDANATETDSADADAEEEKKDDTEASDESDESDDAEEGDAEDAAEKKDEKQYETKLVKKVHRVSLDSNFTAVDIVPMLPEQSLAAKSVMKGIKKRMDEIAELNKVKNDVEAHVFETRDALEYDEPLKKVSTEEEKDTIRSSLSEVEEWLWEDHELKEYKDKLKELRKQIKPLKTRKAELEARPEALKYAHEQIESIKAYLKNETAMADVHPNETAIIEKSTADFEAWLAEKVKAQEGKAVTDTPAFLASEVAEEANIHRTTVTDALRPRAKPKAKKPKKKKETKAEKKLRKLREKAAAAAAKLNTTKVNLAAEEEKVIACAEDKKNEDGEVEKRTEDETKACEAAAEAVKTLTASMGKKEKVVEALAAAVAAAEETETLRATVSEAKANVTAADKVVANLTAMKQDCEDKKAAGTEDESDGTCASVPAELEAAQAALEEAMKVSKDLDAQWDAVMKAEAEAKEAKKKAKEAKEAKEAKKKAKDSGGDGEKDADAEDDGTDAAGKEDASKDKEDKEDL